MTTEKEVEAAHVKRVDRNGGKSLKFSSPNRRNVPDRLDLYGSRDQFLVALRDYVSLRGGYRSEVTVQDARDLLATAIRFTECKAPGKKPRPGQQREIKRLRDMGFAVDIVDA